MDTQCTHYMCKVTSLEGARLHLRQVQGTLQEDATSQAGAMSHYMKMQGYIMGREYKEKEKTPKCYGLVSIKYW